MLVKIRELVQDDVEIILPWLIDEETSKWLDVFFQNKNLSIAQLSFFLMKKDRKTYMVLYDEVPVGMMGIFNINLINKSGEIWSMLGDKNYRNKGIISVAHILTIQEAFDKLKLHSINGWAVEGNFTERIAGKLCAKIIGRQRECHMMDGVLKDRILFDLLKDEWKTPKF